MQILPSPSAWEGRVRQGGTQRAGTWIRAELGAQGLDTCTSIHLNTCNTQATATVRQGNDGSPSRFRSQVLLRNSRKSTQRTRRTPRSL